MEKKYLWAVWHLIPTNSTHQQQKQTCDDVSHVYLLLELGAGACGQSVRIRLSQLRDKAIHVRFGVEETPGIAV